jgi:hypothetical protein
MDPWQGVEILDPGSWVALHPSRAILTSGARQGTRVESWRESWRESWHSCPRFWHRDPGPILHLRGWGLDLELARTVLASTAGGTARGPVLQPYPYP